MAEAIHNIAKTMSGKVKTLTELTISAFWWTLNPDSFLVSFLEPVVLFKRELSSHQFQKF